MRRPPRGGASASSCRPEVYTEHAFPVLGQGTISLTLEAQEPFRIVLNHEKEPSEGGAVLVLEIGSEETCFRNRNDGELTSVLARTTDPRALLEVGARRSYWFSLDRHNRRLRFGKGEMLARLTAFELTLPPVRHSDGSADTPDPFGFIKGLRHIALVNVPDGTKVDSALSPLPVTVDLPPSVVSSDRLTLDDVANNRHTVVANLPEACNVLYAHVGGAAIELDTPDFPDFSAAINRSIVTPGCLCAETLKRKAGEFGRAHPAQTYLRVTLGPNRGDSPGSPYVLEIWPGGHHSPIHHHGGACAVVKVLHGDIWVELFPDLTPDVQPFAEAEFHRGDVTFLTPQLYQVHRLTNRQPVGNMTATLQCYRYPNEDTAHYEYFDYLDEEQRRRQFTPDSDWEYLAFKELIRQEWAERLPKACRDGARRRATSSTSGRFANLLRSCSAPNSG